MMYRIFYFIFLISIVSSFAQNNPVLLPFEHTNKKFGYQDQNGRTLIEPQYEQALPFAGAYAYASSNGQWGLITTKGKWAIPAMYEQIGWTAGKDSSPAVSGDITAYRQNGKWGLISVKNKQITPPVYAVLLYFSQVHIKAGQLTTQHGQTDTLFGIVDTKGKEIIPVQYHTLAPTKQANVLLAGLNKIYSQDAPVQRYGLLSSSNQILVPLHYKQISAPKANEFELTTFHTFHSLTAKGDTLGSFAADSLFEVAKNIYAFTSGVRMGIVSGTKSIMLADMDKVIPEQHGFIQFQSKGKKGLLTIKNNDTQVLLPPQYDSLVIVSGTHIKTGIRQENLWNWQLVGVNESGERLQAGRMYQFIDEIREGRLIRVARDKAYGFINAAGDEVIALQYDSVSNFTDSLCVAFLKGKAGILKKDGSWLFQPAADAYQINNSGLCIRQEKGQWEVLDLQGKRRYISTVPLRVLPDGSIEIRQKGKYGRVSPAGVLCVPAMYDSIAVMSIGQTFWAFQGKNIFLYNSQGDMLIKDGKLIENIYYTPGEYAAVKTGGKYGFVDELGRLRISNRYEGARPFSEGLAAIKLAGKWGFTSRGDKIVIQPYYDEVSSLQGGYIIARKGKKYGLLDKTGKETTDFTFDQIIRHATGYFLTRKGGKQGLLGKNGVESIYVKYPGLLPQPDGHVIISFQDKSGLLTDRGITVLPAIYDQIRYNIYSGSYLLLNRSVTTSVSVEKLLSK